MRKRISCNIRANDFITRIFQQRMSAMPSEKTHVSSIENSEIGIFEPAKEQTKTNTPIRNIRHANDDMPSLFQQFFCLEKNTFGLPRMFQDIAKKYDIEIMVAFAK